MLSPEISQLFPYRLAAIVRWHDKDQATQAALVAAEAGVGSVEITTGTPGAFEMIRYLRSQAQAIRRDHRTQKRDLGDAQAARRIELPVNAYVLRLQ